MAEENQNQPKTDSSIKPLRTYQSDVEQLLKEGEGSFVKIAVAESEKRSRTGVPIASPEAPAKSRVIVFISIALVIIGVAALISLFFFRNVSKGPVTAFEPPPLIVSDSEKRIDISKLNRDKLIATLVNERETNPATLSTVVNIKLMDGQGDTAKPITAQKFFEILQTRAPDELIRTLEDNFTFGLYVLNKNQPFLILKTGYYQNAFAGMLAWEKNIKSDIGRIFTSEEPQATASTSEHLIEVKFAFKDVVIKNRDARALLGKDGKMIFLYTFADQGTIIITTSPDTLDQVTTRLLAGKLVQ